MTDRRGRSGRKVIVSDPTLATEDAKDVGARVQALFAERKQQGDVLPVRAPAPAPPVTRTVEEQLDELRSQLEAVTAEVDDRIAAVAVRADAASVRAARLLTVAQALAVDLDRLAQLLPPDVAIELDAAVARFNAGLRTA